MDVTLPDSFPAMLHEAVEQYLVKHEHSRLLTSEVFQHKVDTSFTAYLEWGNLMVTLRCYRMPDGTFDTVFGVMEHSMIVGDMKVFMKHSDWFN